METSLRVRTTVLPGGRVVVCDPTLRDGEPVEVTVTTRTRRTDRPSGLEIIASLRGHRLFPDPAAVDAYVSEQRAYPQPVCCSPTTRHSVR
jgi:hypothetical protein